MKKTRKSIALCITLVLAMLVCAGAMVAFAADGAEAQVAETVPPVKSLVSTGAKETDMEWGGTGAPGSWDWEIEEIKDPSQADGGDVILRHTLNDDGTVKEAGNFGFSREGMADKAAYTMQGLTLEFYSAASEFMLLFTQNSGWYTGSTYHWGMWFRKDGRINISSVSIGGELNWLSYTAKNRALHTDYKYEDDPATEGYAIAHPDATEEDKANAEFGTLNRVEIVRRTGDGYGRMYVRVNGNNYAFDLYTRGIIENVIDNFGEHGGFITIYQTGMSAQAIKFVNIYNNPVEWSETAPGNMVKIDGDAEFGMDERGNTAVRTLSAEGGSYTARYRNNKVAEFARNLSMKFYYGANNADDVFSVRLADSATEYTAAATEYIDLAFKKTDTAKAELTVSTVDGETKKTLGKVENVPFYFNGIRRNVISLREIINYELIVNDSLVKIDLSEAKALVNTFKDSKAFVDFCVQESKQCTLGIVGIAGADVETLQSVEGLAFDGDVEIKKVEGYNMFYNTTDTEYSVTYTENPIIVNSFELTFRAGKYGEKSKGFRVALLDSFGVGVAFDYAYLDGTAARLTLKGVKGETETKYGEEIIDFDWEFSSANKKLGFVKSGRSGYLAFVDGDVAIMVTDDESIAALDALISDMKSITVNAKFEMQAEKSTAFAFIDYEYHLHTVLSMGWTEGAVPNTDFGYAANDNTVISFGSYSYAKTTAVFVDGFMMRFKSYAKANSAAPVISLSASSAWYSNGTAIQFSVAKKDDTHTTFELKYTNKAVGEFGYAKVNSGNETIDSFTVDWHWNDGIDNIIELNCTEGVWRWTINGAVTEPSSGKTDYSEYYKELFPLYKEDEHTAYVQIFNGKNMVFDISEMNEYNANVDPEVAQAPSFANVKVGDKLTLDLNDVFTDANGDELYFMLDDETDAYQGEIDLDTWTFDCGKEGTYNIKIYAYDGKGGEAECSFTVKAEKPADDAGCGCGSASGAQAALLALALLSAAALIMISKAKRIKE